MKKRAALALLLAATQMVGQAQAFSAPEAFSSGSFSGMVRDGSDLLVSDVFNNVIWRVDGEGAQLEAGRINLAGVDGVPIGQYADGALDEALFAEPWAIAPFADGYAVADTDANVIRLVTEDGVQTAAGSQTAGFRDGRGTKAQFDQPKGLAAGEDGALYIADTGNNAIRRMDAEGNVTTVCKEVLEPTGLCWYDGTLYIAETGRNRICRLQDGALTVVVGGGEADESGYYVGAYRDGTDARFDHPQGLAVGGDGSLYIADTGNGAVRRLKDGRVTTLANTNDAVPTPVEPISLLLSDGTLLAADLMAQGLLKLDLSAPVYDDVAADAWYHDAVYAAAERRITSGTGARAFSPDDPVTRGMFVRFLANLHRNADGHAVIDGEAAFTDVTDAMYFAPAVRWAAENQYVSGYSSTQFVPDAAITREQVAVILYRYAQQSGGAQAGTADGLAQFADAAQVSGYAREALGWAVGQGVVGGMPDGTLQPQAVVTRAQMVKMLISVMDALGL